MTRGDIVLSARLTRLHCAHVTFSLTKHGESKVLCGRHLRAPAVQSALMLSFHHKIKKKKLCSLLKSGNCSTAWCQIYSETSIYPNHLTPWSVLFHKTVLNTSVERLGFGKSLRRDPTSVKHMRGSRSRPGVLALMGAGCRVCTSV